ncbi:MAG: tRNA (adenosine(37)-N6)-dimethylallyltransferase MiaA [Hyphomicrobiaceae bacterium]|nr:tRNA (adenosine(37)-N6)-dimethylallyltransferase MiaA [Hyphomicrobiaceae bacterium]
MQPERSVLIAGPTASGKSARALDLARRCGGIVINADSMQVYAELSILTARPRVGDMREVPHRLYGTVPAAEAYSVGRFLTDAAREIAAARAAGAVPILVGGTGLYFKALTEGLAPVPPIPPEVRARWREAAAVLGPADLHRELAARDPATGARLRPSDRQRIVRALEVFEATGRPLVAWQAEPATPVLPPGTWQGLVVACERDEVYRRCDDRFDAMMAAGALDEVRSLRSLGLDRSLPALRAVGVPPLLAYLDGTSSLDAAVAAAKLDTRHYVKRQLSWLRRNMSAWKLA